MAAGRPDHPERATTERPPTPEAGIEVEAIYQDGVLRPLTPLDLPSSTPVRVRIVPRAALRSTEHVDSRQRLWSPALMAPSGVARFALLLVALVLVGLAQYLFLSRLQFSWAAITAALVSIVAFTGATIGLGDPAIPRVPLSPVTPDSHVHVAGLSRGAFFAVVASALVTVIELVLLAAQPPLPNYNWIFPMWLGAICLYLFGVRPAGTAFAPAGRSGPRRLTFGRRQLLLAMIVAAALLLRVWRLESIPPTLSGDEGSQGLEALKVLNGQITNPFSTGWLGVPTMSFYFNALTIRLLGNTVLALRLPWTLVGTGTVLVTFWLVRRLVGEVAAMSAAALVAAYHYHIHFSRLGTNQVADALFVALALLYFYRGYDRGARLDWALCGVVIGAAQYFYAGARFTGIVIVAVALILWLRDGRGFLRQHGIGLLGMAGAAAITAAPMIQYAIRFPNDYNARLNAVGLFQSGLFQQMQAERGQGPLLVLLDQIRRAGLAFNAYPDRTAWYGLPGPLFDFASGALFLLGLGFATLHLADRRLFPMVAWWWGGMLLGGALTDSPPSSQRLITLAVPAVFFVSLALTRIAAAIQSAAQPGRLRPGLYVVAAVAGLSLISLRLYFVDYTPRRIYGNFNAVVGTELAKYARDAIGPSGRIYFFGPPRMYIGFGTIPYLAPEVEGVDVPDPLLAPPDRAFVLPDKDAVFVFLPERRGELELVRQAFPAGALREVASPLGGDPLFVVYRVPRSATLLSPSLQGGRQGG